MRDCENCEHYKDDGEGIYGCELWDCDKDDPAENEVDA